jgi:hypothetical protein
MDSERQLRVENSLIIFHFNTVMPPWRLMSRASHLT